jgi:CRISPR/Cas system-associated exonuclease Cas4 (RecB family)
MNMTLQSINNEVQETEIPIGFVNYLKKKTNNLDKHNNHRYSVTDIVGCQRKSHYKILEIEEEKLVNDTTVEKMWDSVRGDLLHQITYAYKWREMDIEYDIPLNNGKKAILVGRLDMYDWKTATIIDLKTTKYVKWQRKQGFIPKPEHILQLQCYNTIFSNILPIQNLNILYLDMSDIIAYKISKLDLTNWIKNRIQELEDSITKNRLPDGDISALCQYCRYQTRCYNSGNGLLTKPLSIPKNS